MQLTTTGNHPQTEGKAEQLNKTILTRLRHYVAEQQKDWDTFDKPLTYVYNTQVYRSTYQTRFSLVLSLHLPGPTMLKAGGALPADSDAETTLRVLQ